jgi:hypothetical protein
MHDRYDDRGVPISSGIPPIVVVSALICFVVILTMMTLVFRSSASNHIWPWTRATAIPLS